MPWAPAPTEIDMVIDRGAFLAGRYGAVYDEIAAVRRACGDTRLKVILETGELATYDNVRRASWLAMLAGRRLHQDLDRQGVTGRHAAGDATSCCRQYATGARRPDGRSASSRRVVSGPPRTPFATWSPCARYAGPEWLDAFYFRFGASSLLNDLVLQRRTQLDGHYSGPDYVTVD
jgi:deoxyribose-phosphate aldolase